VAKTTEGPLYGEELLCAVTAEMVALHERYHGRAPATARTTMRGDDLLACLLGDIYTDVEKTMIELQHTQTVHETRSTFQQATKHRFVSAVERLSGRQVIGFISTHHVGPDLEVELFVLAPAHCA
jgi:uncharacterized protein YbcI